MNVMALLVEHIAQALVDRPEDVQVQMVEGAAVTVLELRTAPDDIGKVVGQRGRTVSAIRTLLGAAGPKFHKRFLLEVIDETNSTADSREAFVERDTPK